MPIDSVARRSAQLALVAMVTMLMTSGFVQLMAGPSVEPRPDLGSTSVLQQRPPKTADPVPVPPMLGGVDGSGDPVQDPLQPVWETHDPDPAPGLRIVPTPAGPAIVTPDGLQFIGPDGFTPETDQSDGSSGASFKDPSTAKNASSEPVPSDRPTADQGGEAAHHGASGPAPDGQSTKHEEAAWAGGEATEDRQPSISDFLLGTQDPGALPLGLLMPQGSPQGDAPADAPGILPMQEGGGSYFVDLREDEPSVYGIQLGSLEPVKEIEEPLPAALGPRVVPFVCEELPYLLVLHAQPGHVSLLGLSSDFTATSLLWHGAWGIWDEVHPIRLDGELYMLRYRASDDTISLALVHGC